MNTKKASDYTDRELLEKSVQFAKITADNTGFIKNALLLMIILSIVGVVVIAVQML